MPTAGLPPRASGRAGVRPAGRPGSSSSAALELASAWALSGGGRPPVDPMALAQLAQRAENEYVGVTCGLMDQFASRSAMAGDAMLLDCRLARPPAVPIPATTRPRDLRTPARRGRLGDVRLQRAPGGVRARRGDAPRRSSPASALRDVDPDDARGRVPARRGGAIAGPRHVVTENERVLATATHSRPETWPRWGGVRREPASLRDPSRSAHRSSTRWSRSRRPCPACRRAADRGRLRRLHDQPRPRGAVDALRLAIEAEYPPRPG